MTVTQVPPTVLDVARTVVRLDENAATPAKGVVTLNGQEWTLYRLRKSVADMLAYHFSYHYGGFIPSRRRVTTRDVSAAMAVSGASPFTIAQHARAIADMIRADLKTGW